MTTEILNLASEPAVLAKHGRIVFANSEAQSVLGHNCLNKSIAGIFGPEIAETQASSFIASIPVAGENNIVRVSKSTEGMVLFFSRSEPVPAILSEPFLNVLRSGLMNISMVSDLIRDQAERDGNTPMLSRMATLTKNYCKLIRVCNNASLVMNQGGNELHYTSSVVDLSILCQELIKSLKSLGIEIDISLECQQEVCITASAYLIRQLIMNLISNCIIHASGCTRIRLRLTRANEKALLSVIDDGCGVEPEALHTMLDRYRHEIRLNSMDKGPGLGLTVVRHIAQKQNGSILIESRPNHGTAVHVCLGKTPLGLSLSSEQANYQHDEKELLVGLSDVLQTECYRQCKQAD